MIPQKHLEILPTQNPLAVIVKGTIPVPVNQDGSFLVDVDERDLSGIAQPALKLPANANAKMRKQAEANQLFAMIDARREEVQANADDYVELVLSKESILNLDVFEHTPHKAIEGVKQPEAIKVSIVKAKQGKPRQAIIYFTRRYLRAS